MVFQWGGELRLGMDIIIVFLNVMKAGFEEIFLWDKVFLPIIISHRDI